MSARQSDLSKTEDGKVDLETHAINMSTGDGHIGNSSINNQQNHDKAALNSESSSITPEIDYAAILNKLLPPTIRILAWSPVQPTFSARFDCSSRSYRYYFLKDNLNILNMKTAAEDFRGVHDFSNFCKVDQSRDVSHVRIIEDVGIFAAEDIDEYLLDTTNQGTSSRNTNANTGSTYRPSAIMIFYVKGRAFLWHQVRCMMAILFLVGQELEVPSIVSTLLNDGDTAKGRPCYNLASEHPLVLAECAFPEGLLNWIYPSSLYPTPNTAHHKEQRANVIAPIYTLYAESLIKASMTEYLLQCATLSSTRKNVDLLHKISLLLMVDRCFQC